MNKKTFRQLIVLLVLVAVLSVIIGSNIALAETIDTNDDGVCWWYMNRAHDGAEAARKIGGDNEAILKWFGTVWTEYNELRKEIVARKQAEAQRQDQEMKANLQFLGNYQLTAYPSGTGPNSYNGKSQTLNYTAAADAIPGGTWLYIEGYGEYYVEDSGVGNDYTIDLYMGDHSTCMQFGRKYNVPVYKILNK